ncbi:MAG: protein phosphatase 2C domain-containing protein [Planctomycetaceae bacterium]|jgi:protein phosphatase|nr:protein phosphatase 2C domain-containing protein [Planctomycetaceae bacterium]
MDNIPSHWKKSVRYASLSDVGMRRTNNQDSFGIWIAETSCQWLDRGHFFVVADGMGAHAAGEVASKMAVDTVVQSYLKRVNEPPIQSISKAVFDAHNRIRERSRREDAFRDMGTTCDAFALTPQGLIIAHVGDSRVYRIRANCIEQMTFDHSLVWEVCLSNRLPFDQPPLHIPKNQITRSLGPTTNLRVDVEGPHQVLVGDKFLACSDGLSGQVKDSEIGSIVMLFSPEVAVETLVNLANLRGGPDNTTIVVVEATQDKNTEQDVDNYFNLPFVSQLLLFGMLIPLGGVLFASVYGNVMLGIFSGVIAAVLAICFFATAKTYLFAGSPFDITQTLGNAPYTKTYCQPNEDFANTLSKMLQDIHKAVADKSIKINTNNTNQEELKAKNALKTGDFLTAVRHYAIAINLIMREIKSTK